jgi:hypothetical protein
MKYGDFIGCLSDPVIILSNSAEVLRGNQAACDSYGINLEHHINAECIFKLIPV